MTEQKEMQTTQKFLTAADIIAAADLEPIVIDVPEWGGQVRMLPLSGSQRDSYEASCFKGQGKNVQMNLENVRAKLVGLTVVNENGERLFKSQIEVTQLGKKNAAVLNRLWKKAQEISGLDEEAVKELTGDLKDAPPAASISN